MNFNEGRPFCRISVVCISSPSGALNNTHHFTRGGKKERCFLGDEVLHDLLKQALMKHDVHLSMYITLSVGENELHPLVVSFIYARCFRRFNT